MFNDTKFELLRYGPNQELKSATTYTTSNDMDILAKNTVRDLGILMSDDLKFKDQINTVCTKVRNLCSWIYRTFSRRDEYLMKTLWNSMVQPKIDYCSQLWAPVRAGDLNRIEALQRSYTNRITSIRHLDYWERLSALGMSSQERSFERYKIIYIWKILEGKVPNFGLEYYEATRHGRMCRIPKINTRCSQAIQTLRESSLSVHGPRLFNCLPSALRDQTGCEVDSFKRAINKLLSSIPDQPRLPGYSQHCRAESNSILHMINLTI